MKRIIAILILLTVPYYSSQEAVIKADRKQLIKPVVKQESIVYSVTVNELSVLHPAFRNKVILFLTECDRQGIKLKIIETYRTPQRQDSLKRRGRSMLSGGRSKHQHYLAIDVVPIVNGKPKWHDRRLWNKIGVIGQSYGLKWGGRWRRLYDPGHFEYNCTLDQINQIPQPDTIIIPEKDWISS